jgi:hypothetical protein
MRVNQGFDADWFLAQLELEGQIYERASTLLKKRKQSFGALKSHLRLNTEDMKTCLIALKEIYGEALKFEGKTRNRRYWIEEIEEMN